MASITQHVGRTALWLRQTKGSALTHIWNTVASYAASRRKRERVSAYPFSITVEPALVCNYRCPACRHERRDEAPAGGKFMDVEAYKGLLDQVRGHTWFLALTGNGESTLHPGFHEMVSYAVRNGFYTKVETNGSRIDIEGIEESGLQTLHIALDGMSQETYSRYRVRGDFEIVKQNLERLVELRNRTGLPRLELRFLVFRHNEHEMDKAREYMDSLGIDWRFQWGRIPNGFASPTTMLQKWDLEVTPESFKEWSSTLPGYTAYREDPATGLYRHTICQGAFASRCTGPWTTLFVRCDGEALPCCEMSNEPELSMGNVFKQPFQEVWNGTRLREFRQKLATDPSSQHPCDVCPANLG